MELPEEDKQAFIDAARRRTQEGGAAFGVYPSSGKRPEKLNVSRDVNMPAQMARGWAAGTLGLPGDIEGLGRLLRNIGPEGLSHMRNVSETPVLPTSDFYQEWLPGRDERPAAKAVSGLGALAGGVGSTQLAGAAVKGAKATGKALGPKAAEMAESYLQKSGLAPSVVKPKGGNWLSGSVETATKPLKPADDRVMARSIESSKARIASMENAGNRPASVAAEREVLKNLEDQNALSQWIDKKLNRYIKNEMGTPEDPVRKLAERDVLHIDPEQVGVNRWKAPGVRQKQGYPKEGLGQSEAAKAWEAASDVSIFSDRAGDISKGYPLEIVDANPWLSKLDPSAKVHELDAPSARGLGFDHLIDELRNATSADSDLPANLRWKPEDLQKVTMEQAVERVAKINEYRAAKKAEANEVLARNPATAPYRDYQTVPGTQEPNSKGLSWKQIKAPSNETMPLEERKALIAKLRQEGGSPEKWPRQQLEAALKYEGDVMGHCVGGYCDDVLQGKSQIYSLRDKKGEPHVTIEVAPLDAEAGISALPADERKAFLQEIKDRYFGGRNPNMNEQDKYFQLQEQEYLRKYGAPPPDIVQIKGKGNKAPKAEYLPFVQDFVRSGNWAGIGDYQNTGLVRRSALPQWERDLMPELGEHLTMDEVQKLRKGKSWTPIDNTPELDLPDDLLPPRAYAKGGLVQDTDAIVAQLKGMDKDKALTQALRMANAKQEAHMAAGGLAKLLKGAKKAEDAAKVAKPVAPAIMPPVAPMTKDQMRPIAQRVANQMTGEFVRPDPKFSINPANKSQKVFQRERDLPVEVTQRIPQKPAETIDIEKYEGYGLVGVPGDPTLGGVAKPGTLSQIHEGAEELKRLGDVEFESPVQLFGGPRYGAYSPGEEFWASNIGPARTLQNRVTSTSEALDAPVLGQYIKMSPESTNFALHNLDALLSYMQPEKLGKKSLQELNDEIRKGSPKLGKFPGFAGFEDPIDVLLQSQMHSDLRKHIAETLMKPTVAKKFGLRPGSDVLFGISEPKLRELEAGISGYSVGQMKPGAELTPSLHPTYDYDIPGTFIGQSKYPTPYEIAFPASTAYTRSQLKPGVQEFNMLKMVGPREKIDPQYIDQIKMYEELMKEYTGKKKGGLVKKSGLSVLNKAII
jgi:hypothetical protein